MSGGSGDSVSTGAGPRPSSTHGSFHIPPPQSGNWPSPSCQAPGPLEKDLADYCKLYNEQQSFQVDFAVGSVKYIQAALPAGFTVKATRTWVLVLTGPDGKTNYMFPSTEPAATLDHPLSCATPAPPTCVQTSAAGGTVVVNGGPSGNPSAGYVGSGLTDPRVDILLGTSVTGGMNGIAPPTSAQPLLSNAQLAKVMSDSGFLAYATAQLQHLEDITHQLRSMTPPSMSGSGPSGSSSPSGYPSSYPSSGATDSWPSGPSSSSQWSGSPSGPGTSESSGVSSSWSQPSGSTPSSFDSSPGIPVSSGS